MGGKYVNQSGTTCTRPNKHRTCITTLVDVPKPQKKCKKIIISDRSYLVVFNRNGGK